MNGLVYAGPDPDHASTSPPGAGPQYGLGERACSQDGRASHHDTDTATGIGLLSRRRPTRHDLGRDGPRIDGFGRGNHHPMWDHQYGAGGFPDTARAYRTEQCRGNAAPTAGAHHEKVGVGAGAED